MAGLADIVKITIATQGAQPKQPGFGVLLIADYHTKFSERVRFYTRADDLLTDGFLVTDPAYLAAAACFAQNPRPERVAIGRRALAPTMVVEVTPTAVANEVYKLDLEGLTASFSGGASPTVATITAGLAAALTALAVPGVTVTSDATKVTITGSTAGKVFRVTNNRTSLLSTATTHVDAGIATDLAAINLETSEWYGLTLTTCSKAEILAAAAWVEANGKLFLQQSIDTAIVNTAAGGATDVAATAKTNGYARTVVCYTHDSGHYFGAAFAGDTFPFNPGSLTFRFRQLAGVATSPLTTTQRTNAVAKNATVYLDRAGVPSTEEGKVAAGEWVDVVRDRDWFEARLQNRVFSVLAGAGKVPYTDAGIATIAAEVRAQLAEAVTAGFLAEGTTTVTVPKASAVTPADKAARKLTGVEFSGVIAGAIHAADLTGKITI